MTKLNEPWRDDEPDDMAVMLSDLPDVDPPPALVEAVMSTIARRAQTDTMSSPITLRSKGKAMAKKVLWSVAAAAAVALIVMRALGYPPVENGTEATIGAAQRYQALQISSADVKLQDGQLQAFLQSDAFRRLAADKAAQQALRNKDFQRALAEPAVRAALSSPEVRAAIAASAIKTADASNAKLEASNVKLEASNVKLAASNVTLQSVLESSAALRAALVAPGVADAIASSALAAALAQQEIAFALSQDSAVNAVLSASGVSLDAAAVSSGATAGAKTDAAAGTAH
jgi:hypothetical protein